MTDAGSVNQFQMQRKKRKTNRGRVDLLEKIIGVALVVSVIFPIWAFAGVHDWTSTVMNSLGYLLACLTFLKKTKLFSPQPGGSPRQDTPRHLPERFFTFLGLSILIYVFIHWINARSEFDPSLLTFRYFKPLVDWLPQSYDADATKRELLRLSALGCHFFAMVSWLDCAPKKKTQMPSDGDFPTVPDISGRLSLLIKIVVVSASLVGFVGILQRLDASPKLLWLYTPEFNNKPSSNFGPFAYRGNAATYLNLAWPLALFLLLHYRQIRKASDHSHRTGSDAWILLVPVSVTIIAAALITNSRAGFIVVALQFSVLAPILLHKLKLDFSRRRLTALGVGVCVVGGLVAMGDFRGFERVVETAKYGLTGRIQTYHSWPLEDRRDIYQHFGTLLEQKPVWGHGPGSFSAIYVTTRNPRIAARSSRELVSWAAWAHCDPIEFLVTYGVAGSFLLAAFLVLGVAYPLVRSYKSGILGYSLILAVPMGGFILHSFVDFPFQVTALAHHYLVILAILWAFARVSTQKTTPGQVCPPK